MAATPVRLGGGRLWCGLPWPRAPSAGLADLGFQDRWLLRTRTANYLRVWVEHELAHLKGSWPIMATGLTKRPLFTARQLWTVGPALQNRHLRLYGRRPRRV